MQFKRALFSLVTLASFSGAPANAQDAAPPPPMPVVSSVAHYALQCTAMFDEAMKIYPDRAEALKRNRAKAMTEYARYVGPDVDPEADVAHFVVGIEAAMRKPDFDFPKLINDCYVSYF